MVYSELLDDSLAASSVTVRALEGIKTNLHQIDFTNPITVSALDAQMDGFLTEGLSSEAVELIYSLKGIILKAGGLEEKGTKNKNSATLGLSMNILNKDIHS